MRQDDPRDRRSVIVHLTRCTSFSALARRHEEWVVYPALTTEAQSELLRT
jgi:hypothetical protein